jgi:uncharacterized protein
MPFPKPSELEWRSQLEIRSLSGRKLAGYAATFNTETRIADFVEIVAPSAFTDVLKAKRDILALADHDKTRVLGRTGSGTLRLSVDVRGLGFELDLPDTQSGRDIEVLATRGDLGGMSFGFFTPKGGDSWVGNKRTLSRVDLREISVVSAWPAYEGTSAALRNRTPLLTRAKLYLVTA